MGSHQGQRTIRKRASNLRRFLTIRRRYSFYAVSSYTLTSAVMQPQKSPQRKPGFSKAPRKTSPRALMSTEGACHANLTDVKLNSCPPRGLILHDIQHHLQEEQHPCSPVVQKVTYSLVYLGAAIRHAVSEGGNERGERADGGKAWFTRRVVAVSSSLQQLRSP